MLWRVETLGLLSNLQVPSTFVHHHPRVPFLIQGKELKIEMVTKYGKMWSE